jgi:hypothetical protein
MPGFPGFASIMLAWGAAVLAFAAVRHFYFGGTCIERD